MGFSDEDGILMENWYILKVMEQKKLSKEFLNKGWGTVSTKQTLKKRAAINWHDCKMKR